MLSTKAIKEATCFLFDVILGKKAIKETKCLLFDVILGKKIKIGKISSI